MTKIIAVSGKGGVGKTTVAALLIKWLNKTGVKSLLAIDADPDSNLPEALGTDFEKTIGDIREDLLSANLPPGINKRAWIDSKIFEITKETKNFDLIVMGRPEGQGCYCAVNHILREIIDSMVSAYDYVVIDCEAGMEHLSRRTTENVDVMLIVTDASRKGFETASRIKELAEELDIEINNIFLILNRIKESNKDAAVKIAKSINMEVIGILPEDDIVSECDLKGEPVYELNENSGVYNEVGKVLGKIIEKSGLE